MTKIGIDSDVIEGSVEIRRNGLPSYAFTVDKEAGVITLATAPGLDEEIVVSYLRESSDRSTGSIAAGVGGIFDLGAGTKAWTALGLRWSVPGTSYSSSGISDPGSIIFTAGEKGATGGLSHEAAIGGAWSTEVASGVYRLEGMEGSGNYVTSFWDSNNAYFKVAETSESLLSSAFPKAYSTYHSDASAQQAMKITALADGQTLSLVKYIDEPPLANLKVFSFFLRVGDVASVKDAVLTISLDCGASGEVELSLPLPLSAAGTSWRRFVLRYGYGDKKLYYQDSEDGSLTELGVVAVVDPSVAAARRLSIGLSGLGSGAVVWLDELGFQESSGQASLLGKGSLGYEKADLGLSLGRPAPPQRAQARPRCLGGLFGHALRLGRRQPRDQDWRPQHRSQSPG